MKKKGMKTLAAAAVLSFGILTMNAYAAEGWAMSSTNTWIYLDNNGGRIRNEWKRGADNLWRWLNSNGEMAINAWADEDYYVDSNGIMVTDKWMQLQDPYERNGTLYWYYFGSNGKMTKESWKKIDGKSYLFDTEGKMRTGWSEDGLYYLGSDGAMKTGWRYLEPQEEDNDEYHGEDSDDGKYWYYFGSNGKKYTPETQSDGKEYRVSKIGNEYFCFSRDGRMMTGWVYMEGDPESAPSNTIEDWRYFAEPEIKNVTMGSAVKGWLSLEPPEKLQGNVEDSVVWYYFNKDGSPKYGPEYDGASTDDFVKVDGKSYLFNSLGNPVSGLRKVQIGKTGKYTAYYFDESSKTPIKGKKTIEEGDGTKSTFYFNEGTNAGHGVTGAKNGYLYYMGKRQEADTDSRYILVSLPNGSGYDTYVVNTSGRISKSTTVKDRDGNKYKVNGNGILQEINGEAADRTSRYGEPVEPVFTEDDF